MATIIAIVIFFVGAIIWGIVSGIKSSNSSSKHEEIFKRVLTQKGLPPDQILFTSHNDSRNCISVNESNSKVSFGYVDPNKQFVTKEYDFTDIVSFEVQIDDKSSRKVSVGGAIVGGALGGGLGALVGSQSGKQKTKVRKMHLIITVNSISDPVIRFSIMSVSSDGKGWDSDSFIVERALERAEKWTGIFNVILKRNG